MQTIEKSRTGNDCVIVALSNYFQKPYETVLADCYTHISTSILKENHFKNGFYAATYVKVFELYVNRKSVYYKPRGRGANNLTGIVRLARPNHKTGHLVMMVLGKVYDNGTETPIKEYRNRTGFNIKGVWM